MTCKLCKGARHRWDAERGVHVRCECLRDKQSTDRYERAGVATRFQQETWRAFLDGYEVTNARALVSAARSLKAGEQPADWLLVYGRPERARQVASALILRGACDGMLEAKVYDVPSLIDVEFQPGRGQHVLALPALVIWIGGEPGNKWNRIVLEKVLRERWAHQRFTLMVSDVEPTRIATNYKSGLIEESLNDRFVKVKLAPR